MSTLTDPARFWGWFVANEARLRSQGRACDEAILDEILEHLHEYCPALFFEIGGAPEGPCEFVVTAEGKFDHLPSVHRLVEAAPALPGWRFIAFKPAQGLGFITTYEGVCVDPSACWFLHLTAPKHPGQLGLRVAVPGYERQSHDLFADAVWVALDTMLGELVTARDIHYLEVGPVPERPEAEQYIEFEELPRFLDWLKR